MSSSGSPMEHLAGVQPQGESVAQSFVASQHRTWLIFADSGGVGEALCRSVRSTGR